MHSIQTIQQELQNRGMDAWLFCDHHHRDPIAYRILGLPESLMVTRRWYYFVPAHGLPLKLVHRIEAFHLDSLPGEKREYAAGVELTAQLKELLGSVKNVAMQFSPNNLIFTISLVDAGTVDLVRSMGVNVVSSADLVAKLEAVWTPQQIATHFAARDSVDRITTAAFCEIGRRISAGGTTEFEIQQWLQEAFRREDLVSDAPPLVAVNANSSNPHYSPTAEHSSPIGRGDFVLLDIWAKKNVPDAVYYDISWTGFAGTQAPDRIRDIFEIVRRSRDAGIQKVQQTLVAGKKLAGWEVDKASRDVLVAAGYGAYLNNRVGHSIGTEVHGNGAHMDNFEVHDEREVIPHTCFSIEPGIYLPEFGLRSEINMLVNEDSAEVTGMIQQEVVVF
jgi:Xaa-Pro aminopeptidase